MALLLMLFLLGCGDDATGPDPQLTPFVGDWSATELVLTSVANPDVASDLIELGANFKLNVQPSGQYTAILIVAMQTSTEIGRVTISGNTLTLSRNFPTPSTTTGVYQFFGSDFVLDGETEFDFNLDGTAEAARVHFRFSPA